MADKIVSISVNNDKNLKITFKHVTQVDVDEELEADSVKTFDGPVSRGTDNPSYKIDINKLDLETMSRYVLIKKILKALRNNYGAISVSEIVRPKGEGAFKVTQYYSNVLISGNKHTISAEDLTARELSFIAENCADRDPVRL